MNEVKYVELVTKLAELYKGMAHHASRVEPKLHDLWSGWQIRGGDATRPTLSAGEGQPVFGLRSAPVFCATEDYSQYGTMVSLEIAALGSAT